MTATLRGNDWLGHPLHPVIVMVPVGAWSVTGWYDLRGAISGQPDHDQVADAALRVGVLTALPAAVTGLVQFLDTRGASRRQTAVHAGLNYLALALYVASLRARRAGRRSAGRRLATGALLVVGLSGYLGDDLAYRHGVGVHRSRG
ncbi:DUF2231 domain-containing protein [Thalassiella azotivora]